MKSWTRTQPLAGILAAGAAFAVAAMVVSGCSNVTKTLRGGQAIGFANATRDEEKARALTDVAMRRDALSKAYDKYLSVIADDPTGSFSNRARYAAAQIKKELTVPGGKNYDEAIELLNQIVATTPTGYRAGLARSEIAAVNKNRQTIRDAQRTFDNTPADASDKMRLDALEALYEVGRSFEVLRDYHTSIEKHRELIRLADGWRKSDSDDFARKAARSQFQIGSIYFYRLYDYATGWPEFVRVFETYPTTFESEQAQSLLKRAKVSLDGILADQEYIRSKRKEKASEFKASGRRVNPNELYGVYGEQVAQTYLNIAQAWERDPLRNLPNAVDNYRQLVEDLWNQGFIASDAMYQIGRLYQDNGEYENAIEAYDELFERFPQAFRRGEAVYAQAVCYETIREFEIAYRQYQAAASLGTDTPFFRAAEQKVRQFEQDEDGDGLKFYQEQQAGTSDKPSSATAN
ncbi:tetratricopeptide repeat protein [Candidatus Poribacteria bacterium]|nr:tetratricopeptide repeat protein [Candidatus Poribacteria bacterium]